MFIHMAIDWHRILKNHEQIESTSLMGVATLKYLLCQVLILLNLYPINPSPCYTHFTGLMNSIGLVGELPPRLPCWTLNWPAQMHTITLLDTVCQGSPLQPGPCILGCAR